MIGKQFICDQCGRAKGAVNHWYRIRLGEAFHIYKWESALAADDDSIEVRHVCSQECLLKQLQNFLNQKEITNEVRNEFRSVNPDPAVPQL
jgi:hypothetical protein